MHQDETSEMRVLTLKSMTLKSVGVGVCWVGSSAAGRGKTVGK